MPFRALFWNIEDFAGGAKRTRDVVDHIRQTDPDIIGICEVRNKDALREMIRDDFSDFDFAITDGQQEVELAVGWRRGMFEHAIFTQRREFKASNPDLRPGALLTVRDGGAPFHLLFLHADSGRKLTDYANRQEVFDHVWSLKAALDRIEGDDARLIVMGDLNTMGHDAKGKTKALHGMDEIREVDRRANKKGMNLLNKSHTDTFLQVNDGKIKFAANLDHVLISHSVSLGKIGNARVLVRGWVDGSTDFDKTDFVDHVSDHCSVEVLVKGTRT